MKAEGHAQGPREAGSQAVLHIENLRKVFPQTNGKEADDLVVMDGVSFDVNEGEFVTILGPSGCGKTTLLNIVAGMEGYDGGVVSLKDHQTGGSADTVIIFQEDALFPWLTVEQNVAFALKARGVQGAEMRRLAAQYVDMVQLTQFAGSYMHQLSGGMKQRVAIARGLAADPKMLLMDEPFGALDYRTREILQGQIQQIHASTAKTIIFVTHDVREAASLGDRVILLSRRPAHVKHEYAVDLPRPRSSEDPELHEVITGIQRDLKEEVGAPGAGWDVDGASAD